MGNSKIKFAQSDYGYSRMVLYGLATELVLIVLQFGYIQTYTGDTKFVFDDNYMRYGGFYIFQVIGFFLYITMAFLLSNRIQNNVMAKIALFVVAGCLLEYVFYFTIQAEWQGVFSYSVLSKLIAGTFGFVISRYTLSNPEHKTQEQ